MSTTVIPNASGGSGGSVTAGTGVTVDGSEVSIGQDVATSASPSFAALTTTGAVSAGGQVSSVATIGLLTSHVTTDATNKTGIVAARHYTNANRPVGLVAAVNDSSQNTVYIGGGTADVNAATLVAITTATNNNTATGTTRTRWQPSGERQDGGISTTPAGAATRSTWWTDTSGNPYVRVGTGRIIDIGALGLTATAVQTGNYTAAAGECVMVDPSAATGDITINLPATAAPCAVMLAAKANGRWKVLINRNGNTVNGLTDTSLLAMRYRGQMARFWPVASGYAAQVDNPPNQLSSYNFDGSTSYAVANSAAININGALSISCWIYATGSGSQVIWGGYNASSPFNGYGLSIGGGTTSDVIEFWDSTAWRAGNRTVSNKWTHVGVVYNGSNLVTFYIDGRRASTSVATALSSFTGSKRFGATSGDGGRINSLVQDFRIFNVALTDANWQRLFNNGRGWPYDDISGCVLWYLGDEGSGSSCIDLISGNNGIVTGSGGFGPGILRL